MIRGLTSPWMKAGAATLGAVILYCLFLQDARNALPYFAVSLLKLRGNTTVWDESVTVKWKPCFWWNRDFLFHAGRHEETNGYLKIECTGGLNQMRRDLCDGVGIARLLNATLLLPRFDAASYWNDTSGFAEIFDVDFFIEQTKSFLPVVKELPRGLNSSRPFYINCRKRKTAFDYITEVLPALQKYNVVIIRPAASQRADRYPLFAKAARCEACFNAIRLVPDLTGRVNQIMLKLPKPFLSLHLRFEPDMIAFSRCQYPTLSKETLDKVEAVRGDWEAFKGEIELSWRGRGKCLLTPGDVAMTMQALNIPRTIPIYLATGDGLLEKDAFTSVYGNIFNKSMLLDALALETLGSNSKAAIDYLISVNADYYIATHFGNMEKMVLPMRILNNNWKSLVLKKKDFATATKLGLNGSKLMDFLWESHVKDFVKGGLPLPDCFCESSV